MLRIRADDRVLEIGCGHGVALGLVAAKLAGGSVVGIDRSAKMTAVAKRRNAAAIREGRVEVRTGVLASVDLGAAPFDVVFAINVSLFGRDADAEIERLRTVLAPRGTVMLFFESPAWAHAERFLANASRNFEANGFHVKGLVNRPLGVAIVCTKSSSRVRARSSRS